MPYITKKFLENYQSKSRVSFDSKKLFESIEYDYEHYDIFISYSSKDLNYVKTVAELLIDQGFLVYIDDNDSMLDKKNVTDETPKRLARIMESCACLVYVCTDNSVESLWCPWEIGYMSCKSNFKCAILPVIDEINSYIKHREYLLAYPEIIQNPTNRQGNIELVINKGDKISLRDFVRD